MNIVALNGFLGYGYSEIALEEAFSEKVDYVGVEVGFTDPGPYCLGSGRSFTDRSAVKHDLALALSKVLAQKALFIIGSAAGAGSSDHVAWLKEIILEVAKEQGLHFAMGIVHSDETKEYVLGTLTKEQVVKAYDVEKEKIDIILYECLIPLRSHFQENISAECWQIMIYIWISATYAVSKSRNLK